MADDNDKQWEKSKIVPHIVTEEERRARLEGDWSSAQIDKYKQAAAKVLPCDDLCSSRGKQFRPVSGHTYQCHAWLRSAVAQAMRELVEQETAALRKELNEWETVTYSKDDPFWVSCNEIKLERDRLKAEVEGLKVENTELKAVLKKFSIETSPRRNHERDNP